MSTAEANALPPTWNRLSKMGRTAVVLRVLAMVILFCSWFVPEIHIIPGSETEALVVEMCAIFADSASFTLAIALMTPVHLVCGRPTAAVLSTCICITSALGCVLKMAILTYFLSPPLTPMKVAIGLDLTVLFLCCISATLDHCEMAKLVDLLLAAGSNASPSPTSAGKQEDNDNSSVV